MNETRTDKPEHLHLLRRVELAEKTIALVRADCEQQTSRPITDDVERGIWAQARRTLKTLDCRKG